jgi:hypothetical protein
MNFENREALIRLRFTSRKPSAAVRGAPNEAVPNFGVLAQRAPSKAKRGK